jgi:cilia- and flagella-associated protein 57
MVPKVAQGSPIHQCSFSPFESNVVCLVGKDCVKYYRLVGGDIRLLSEVHMKDHDFISHCWLRQPDDHVLAATDNGKIVLFCSGEKLFTLDCCDASDGPISSLIAIGGGFVAGVGLGKFIFFSVEFNEGSRRQVLLNEHFRLAHSVSSELSKREAVCLALSPSEEKLCALTADGQLLSMPLQSSVSMLALSLNSDSIRFTVSSFHGPRSIVGMDVCTRKPLFVTVGKDNTLRVWNIQSHQLDLMKEFGEEMFSVALHPNGLHLAVGFLDKVRLYHILLDDLRLCIELPVKCCRVCEFSQGGNLLATVNGSIISVFDTHSGDRVVDLRGHNSKVRSLHWLQSGFQLLSCGQDGVVYLWDLDGPKRTGEFVKKRTMYTSVVIAQVEKESQMGGSAGTAPVGESVFVVGSDKMLSELQLPDLAAKRHYDVGVMTHLAISAARNVLLASAGEPSKPGFIKAFSYPVTGESDEYPCLGAPIAAMKLTPDGLFLLAADESGCIALFELKEKQERIQLNAGSKLPDLVTSYAWNDEVLVTRTELEDRAK